MSYVEDFSLTLFIQCDFKGQKNCLEETFDGYTK